MQDDYEPLEQHGDSIADGHDPVISNNKGISCKDDAEFLDDYELIISDEQPEV